MALHSLGERRAGKGETTSNNVDSSVMTYRVDDFVRQFGLPSPTHLKIDVDGGELGVLKGGARLLRSTTLKSILIEVNGEDASEKVDRLLTRAGFQRRTERSKTSADQSASVTYCVYERVAEPVHWLREAGERITERVGKHLATLRASDRSKQRETVVR
jgi:hypothetical protein